MRKKAAALGLISNMKHNRRSHPDCAFSLAGQPLAFGGITPAGGAFFIGGLDRTAKAC